VLGWIVKHKGEKQIKVKQKDIRQSNGHIIIYALGMYEQMLIDLQKSKFKSYYEASYGRKPALTDLTDTDILKYETFSQLECSFIFTKLTRIYLGMFIIII
jgi:hypothetical protein